MDRVFILFEESDCSQLCGIRGGWKNRADAIEYMLGLIAKNQLYSEHSNVDIEKGRAESDPFYCEENYSNYTIKEIIIN